MTHRTVALDSVTGAQRAPEARRRPESATGMIRSTLSEDVLVPVLSTNECRSGCLRHVAWGRRDSLRRRLT